MFQSQYQFYVHLHDVILQVEFDLRNVHDGICSKFDNCRCAKRKHCVLLFKYEHVGLLSIQKFCCCFCFQCANTTK